MVKDRRQVELFVDASLESLGACWEGKGYAMAIPETVKYEQHIGHFEMYNVVVAFL